MPAAQAPSSQGPVASSTTSPGGGTANGFLTFPLLPGSGESKGFKEVQKGGGEAGPHPATPAEVGQYHHPSQEVGASRVPLAPAGLRCPQERLGQLALILPLLLAVVEKSGGGGGRCDGGGRGGGSPGSRGGVARLAAHGGPSAGRGWLTRKHFSLCALSMLEKRKRWPHTSHGYGFSPVCVRRCRFMLGRLVKLLPQISQMYGFSPGVRVAVGRHHTPAWLLLSSPDPDLFSTSLTQPWATRRMALSFTPEGKLRPRVEKVSCAGLSPHPLPPHLCGSSCAHRSTASC